MFASVDVKGFPGVVTFASPGAALGLSHWRRVIGMRITLFDLEREPVRFETNFSPRDIDFGQEVEQLGPLQASGLAELLEEHRGPRDVVKDIRLRGGYEGLFAVPCARCLDAVEHPVEGEYDLLFRPTGVDADEREHALGASETEIGYYQDSSLVVDDVLREQVLLSLPAKTLCREECKGLCPRCGANRNTDSCSCEEVPADARWSALGDLRSRLAIP